MPSIEELERMVIDALPAGQYINGQWVTNQTTIPVENPATGQIIAEVHDADPATAMSALDAAAAAQPAWAATKPRDRAEILRRAFDLVQARRDLFAACMTMEMGKPFAEAQGEVDYGTEYLRWYSEQASRNEGYFAPSPTTGRRTLTMRMPVGPVLAITPWNFPLAMATRKIAPAMAAGCTSIVKPAKLTPLTMLLFMQILEEAGTPAGVVNCFTTNSSGGTTGPLLADERLRKVTFTGSTEVGRGLLRQAADQVLKSSMELGGNAPLLILPDADLDKAVQGAFDAKMRNLGESCVAANRIYVHESMAEEFTKQFTERMAAQKVGYGLDPSVNVGPLVDAKQRDTVLEFVQDAIDRGGKLLTGGKAIDGPGYFMEPTVVGNIQPGTRILKEEIFGPFAPIITYSDVDEAVAMANDTEFGLAAYLFTENLSEMFRVAEELQVGILGINTGVASDAAAPFGGVKQSGLGREGSAEGIDEYLETRYLSIKL